MKKIIFAAIFIAGGLAVFAQAPTQTGTSADNPNGPIITFEKEVIDYGTIEFGSDGNREFKFKNTGKEPLIIYSATGSCGCTVPTAPKEPIKPGETGIIKVHYDTKRPGSFEKSITVASNAKNAQPSITLKVKGTVKAAPATNASPSSQ